MSRTILSLGAAVATLLFTAPASAVDHAPASTTFAGAEGQSAGPALQTARDFVNAYVQHDAAAIKSIVTNEFEILYAFADPGVYVSLDKDALVRSWNVCKVPSGPANGPIDATVYRAIDDNHVFLTYRNSSNPDSVHVALLEVRDGKIAQVRQFGPSGQTIAAPTTEPDDPTSIILGCQAIVGR